MLHTEKIRNESDFKWHEWYSGSPVREEFQCAFSREIRDDHHLDEAMYYVVYNGDNELLLIKTFPKEDRANLSFAIIKNCDKALCLKSALGERIVTQCLEEDKELILIPNIPASMNEVFERLASLHDSEPIEGVTSILIGPDEAARVYLRSTLPPII
jgi:hypothetical protein